ncbi:MAG: redoxin domain-containing protein [Alphaproteobacteria bacterium]|nr:redoxin domain-containing protein [Alphaproteobacteria bacterium]
MRVQPGDPAPLFRQRAISRVDYSIDAAAGRYLVLCFHGSAAHPLARRALAAALARPDLFNDDHAAFFGVSNDPDDERLMRVRDRYPGYRHIWDFDTTVAQLYGAMPSGIGADGMASIRPAWVVIGPSMRIMKTVPFQPDGGDIAEVLAFVEGLPPVERATGIEMHAPVFALANVFEPDLCARLIEVYRAGEAVDSGFMREEGGKTVGVVDHRHKRRRDCLIESDELTLEIQRRVRRRIVPELKKVHQFEATRMERYIVACYSADDGGHFRPHRDNTTSGTAHRRFAVSINLNADFDGGDLVFPEYGPRAYRPPLGGAVVFSCSLQHAVTEVVRGERFAFLPFLYDEAAAIVRRANNDRLGEGVLPYGAGGEDAREEVSPTRD